MNINYINCEFCKNIFLKTHIKVHYQHCSTKINFERANSFKNYKNSLHDSSNSFQKNNEYYNKKPIPEIKQTQTQMTNIIIRPNEIKKTNTLQQNTHQNTVSNNSQNRYNYHQKSVKVPKKDTNNTQITQSLQEIQNMQIEKYIPPHIVSYNDNMINHFFKEYEKLFCEFVRDKCIALVGPAQSILETRKGDVIDKFDLVVRLNKSLPLPQGLKDDIGSRTDIIYNSLNTSDFPGENNLNPKLYKKYGVQFVCSSYPFNHVVFHDDILNYVQRYKFELPLKVMNDMKFKRFEQSLGTRPYTGTCAIMDLLSYPIKYLYITGLDFYHTKYINTYRKISKEGLRHTKNSTIHQAQPQLEYLRNISFFDNRIILDGFLDKLVYHEYYKVLKNLNAIDKNIIFRFNDNALEKYFSMKLSHVTFTKSDYNKGIDNDSGGYPFLVITDNKKYMKRDNEYCLFMTNDTHMLNFLNNNLQTKKYIGNFFYSNNKQNTVSIYLTGKFLESLKQILYRIGITNCSVNIAILIGFMLYLPDKHYFSSNEIFNYWNLTQEEKKLVIFLYKKKILILI
jgi:hypothetical protein